MHRVPLDAEGWRILVRRALGIPDVVGDGGAVEVVTDLIYTAPIAANEVRGRNVEFEEGVGNAILDAVVHAGELGQLDRFIMSRPNSSDNAYGEPDVGEVDNRVLTYAREAAGAPQLPPGLALPLLLQVKAFVTSHPLYPNG